jgi:hypothetical protein
VNWNNQERVANEQKTSDLLEYVPIIYSMLLLLFKASTEKEQMLLDERQKFENKRI